MRFFTNDDTRRLQIHSAFHSLAIHMAAIFSAAYLLKSGLTPSQVFLTFAGIYAVRIVVRPLMIAIAPAVGLKALLIAGSFLIALSYAAISIVDGFNWKLVVYGAFAGLANMVYWTAFHPAFAAAGESHDRGRQVGARQSLSALASIAGPVLSGALLTIAGPWAAFGFACLALLAGIVPLFAIADTPVARVAPPGAWRAALPACGLFAADGFVWTGAGVAWHITLFVLLGERFDSYGSALAFAALIAAAVAWFAGRSIDLGHGLRATLIAAVISCAVFAMRALLTNDLFAILFVLVASTLMMSIYMPVLMTAIYNDAKSAPCPLRFQAAAETAWDIGSICGALLFAALIASGVQLQWLIWLAIPAVVAQNLLLARIYARRARGAGAPAIS